MSQALTLNRMSEKVKRVKYTPEAMATAIAQVRGGMAKKTACRMYGVPRTTLLDKLAGRVPETPTKPGPSSILSAKEEEILVTYVCDMAKIGHPLTTRQLKLEVKRLMDEDGRHTPFHDNLPGILWLFSA